MSVPFPLPAVYAAGGDGFSPPQLGGDEAVMYFPFVFGTPSGTRAFTLFAGSTITEFVLTVQTTFNNTPTLSVGHTGLTTFYMNAGSVLGTAGQVFSTAWDTTKWYTRLTGPENITITLGGTANQGAGVLAVRYILK